MSAYTAAYLAAKPYAVRIADQRIRERKVLPEKREHEIHLWRNALAAAAVQRGKPVSEIAAVQMGAIKRKAAA